MALIPVVTEILQYNDAVAQDVRRAVGPRTLTLNLVSSPGAGKTTLIERTAAALEGELRLAVIEGDLATSLDAARVAAHGVSVVQINTGSGCHLEARQIMAALPQLALDGVDVLIIENVGNLICPSEFDLGEDAKVIVTSLPEGEDKPLKYPGPFLSAKVVIVNKVDLVPYLPVHLDGIIRAISSINGTAPVIPLSCLTGEGMEAWLGWIRLALESKRSGHAPGGSHVG